MTAICRVCHSPLPSPDFISSAPALTSITTHLAVFTQTTICRCCGHVQSPDLPDIQDFYRRQYRISLQSEQHDQLYEIRDKKPVFRTEYQAELLAKLNIPYHGRVLDFGAAKAATLRRLTFARPDIKPSVFDVSTDYAEAWRGWIDEDEQAIHQLPPAWRGRFDLITAHFVLEHVADPVACLASLSTLLAQGGTIFFTVPDPLANIGDLLVVDHLNHFTESSIHALVQAAGLKIDSLSRSLYRGAFVVIATHQVQSFGDPHKPETSASDVSEALAALEFWKTAFQTLKHHQDASDHAVSAIYGAGFYGALIASRLKQPPVCFLDRNPFLHGQFYMGVPICAPESCPTNVKRVYVGLNPSKAPELLGDPSSWLPHDAAIIYLGSVLNE